MRVLLGVCGSVHAAFTPNYLRALGMETNLDIAVVVTNDAQRFVSKEVCLAMTRGRTFGPDDDLTDDGRPRHIALARWADHLVVAPASANTLAKLAHGVADNLLTEIYLAYQGPRACAPAMNATMYTSAAVQRNLRLLEDDGVRILPTVGAAPVSGAAISEQSVSSTPRIVRDYLREHELARPGLAHVG